MASMQRCDLVIDTCTALSSIFRYSIRENDRVCLEEELRYARSYFYVMNQRYRGELELIISVGEADRGVLVPKMILQPVLENSLKHGGLDRLEHGTVAISAGHEDGLFVILVRDNGRGIAPDALKELRRSIESIENGGETRHVGLRNLSGRLRLSCGGKSGLSIDSEEGGFTQVRLVIDQRCADKRQSSGGSPRGPRAPLSS